MLISKIEAVFLRLPIKSDKHRLFCLRMTVNVHKFLYKISTIVSSCSTIYNDWGRWLNY